MVWLIKEFEGGDNCGQKNLKNSVRKKSKIFCGQTFSVRKFC